jgi:hypothetical protein
MRDIHSSPYQVMRAHTSVTEARDVRVMVRLATLNNRVRLRHINVKMKFENQQ